MNKNNLDDIQLNVPFWLEGSWVDQKIKPAHCFHFSSINQNLFIYATELPLTNIGYNFGCDYVIHSQTSNDSLYSIDAVSNLREHDILKMTLHRDPSGEDKVITGTIEPRFDFGIQNLSLVRIESLF